MTTETKILLVVDDGEVFLRTVVDGFRAYAGRVEVVTAQNGREALAVLASRRVDLVVTDLKMPEVDGFELLAAMSRSYPHTPVLVMTAFGTPQIEARLKGLGVSRYLEKPLDFGSLAKRVLDTLSASARGTVQGITLPSFLQIIRLERKSCVLSISSSDAEGRLGFIRGELVDAATGGFVGDAAALEIVCWDDARIEMRPMAQDVNRTVQLSLTAILMEGIRQKDERDHDLRERPSAMVAEPEPPEERMPASGTKERREMNPKEKLQELANIEGFAGAAVFTPTGEELVMLPGSVQNVKDVGVLANAVLMNAQKASLEMGAGRGQLVHVEGEKSHILVRCHNEGTDPLRSQPQRAHIHTVLILKPDASLGMAKLKLSQIVEKLAEDFR
jgi:CheY-like chemotaxis protein